MITKPLLASSVEDLNLVKYKVLLSHKLDGIRCLIVDGKAVSRNLKPIPNRYIRETLEKICVSGLDGEIIVGNTFQECTSAVMSFGGEPDFTYHIFDYVKDELEKPFTERLKDLQQFMFNYALDLADKEGKKAKSKLKLVQQYMASCPEDIEKYQSEVLAQGYEGVMIRSLNGKYKCGRSSVKEGILLKVKKFADSEAEVVGFEELMHNENESEINALGLSERSSNMAGLVPANTLGALLVRDIHSGIEFKLGTGFTQEARKEIWSNRRLYEGRLAKYKYFEIGVKIAPRFPVFLGFRDKADM